MVSDINHSACFSAKERNISRVDGEFALGYKTPAKQLSSNNQAGEY
jgi:hypothetical protein